MKRNGEEVTRVKGPNVSTLGTVSLNSSPKIYLLGKTYYRSPSDVAAASLRAVKLPGLLLAATDASLHREHVLARLLDPLCRQESHEL